MSNREFLEESNLRNTDGRNGVSQKKMPTGNTKIVSLGGNDLKHPRSGEVVPAAGLGASIADFQNKRDRREVLADWMVSKENPFFARTIANRLWSHYFGRGVVEPIDDMRATNPPTNEALLNALSKHMVDVNYDLKAFTATMMNSRAYQLASTLNESNELDEQNFSHASYKSLPAEVILDAICQTTDVAEDFNGWPSGYRAIEIWDNHMPSYFFKIFGRPARVSVCECERGNEPSIAQALHLMNSPESMEKIRNRNGRAARLAQSKKSADEIIEELYLTTLARFPKQAEFELMRLAFKRPNASRRSAVEDVLWALLNSREFVYNH